MRDKYINIYDTIQFSHIKGNPATLDNVNETLRSYVELNKSDREI